MLSVYVLASFSALNHKYKYFHSKIPGMFMDTVDFVSSLKETVEDLMGKYIQGKGVGRWLNRKNCTARPDELHAVSKTQLWEWENQLLQVFFGLDTHMHGHTYACAHIYTCVCSKTHKEAHMNELKHMHTLIKVYKRKYSLKNF